MKKVYLTESELRGVIHNTIQEESIFSKEVVERLLQEQSFFKDGRNPLYQNKLNSTINNIKRGNIQPPQQTQTP